MAYQSLAHALWPLGYTRTLLTDKLTNAKRTHPANPDAIPSNPGYLTPAEHLARWGAPIESVDGGALEGGAIKSPTPELLGYLGLPIGYQWTWLDKQDASVLTRNGVTWACDDSLLVPDAPPDPIDPPIDPPPPVIEPLSPRIPEAAYRKLRAKVNLFSVMGPLKYQALQSVLDYLDTLRKWQDEDEVE